MPLSAPNRARTGGAHKARHAVGLALALALCACFRPAPIAGFPATIGPQPAAFRLPGSASNVGPQFRVYLLLPEPYRIRLGSRAHSCEIDGPNGSIVVITASWIGTDGVPHPMDDEDCVVDGTSRELGLFSRVIRPAQPRAAAIALSSTSPIKILRARWWSGDPESLCFFCL